MISTIWGSLAIGMCSFCGERCSKLLDPVPRTKLLLSGSLPIKNPCHYELASLCFSYQEKHTSRINRSVRIGVTGVSFTVNQELTSKVLMYFSLGSISVSKRSNHFCFNNKIKFQGMCVCSVNRGRDKFFCPQSCLIWIPLCSF